VRGGAFHPAFFFRSVMTVIVSMLRGVNVGGHNLSSMAALRALYESLGFEDSQTYIQSGNVVFRTKERNLTALGAKIGSAIEQKFGFRPGVVLRTPSELRHVIAANPFAKRAGIEPAKLHVMFLSTPLAAEVQKQLLALNSGPEELRIVGRELYVYYPEGAGKSKLFPVLLGHTLKNSGTSRNWNTVTKLLKMAEELEAGK